MRRWWHEWCTVNVIILAIHCVAEVSSDDVPLTMVQLLWAKPGDVTDSSAGVESLYTFCFLSALSGTPCCSKLWWYLVRDEEFQQTWVALEKYGPWHNQLSMSVSPSDPWAHIRQLLNGDSGGHLISKTLLEESLRALFNHGWQWKLTGSDNSSSCLEFPDSFPATIEQLVFIYFSESEISVVNCGMHSLACPSGTNLMAL